MDNYHPAQAILPSSASQQKRTSGSRDDGTRLINRNRGSSHIRPSSCDVVKPLSSYGQLPFRLAILWSLEENLLRVTLPPIAKCMLQLLTELC
ncbi:hypothetical protein DPMN_073703 [Dreissena polymorpha]|uniref:Uncharacterized protein n=1 Tax=Dreissena polymorpha TaxID=45954 RepID=A0A9D4HCE7_DREPO|nr:hypothetical protein DPMN_072910 [Dreissena polymorpha]KAH3713902.1 hypothetical protein DPMN_073703 [Dreissena polymorpha]